MNIRINEKSMECINIFFMAMWASSIWKNKITFSTGKKTPGFRRQKPIYFICKCAAHFNKHVLLLRIFQRF